jgi:hypothetical protein
LQYIRESAAVEVKAQPAAKPAAKKTVTMTIPEYSRHLCKTRPAGAKLTDDQIALLYGRKTASGKAFATTATVLDKQNK